MALSFYFHNGSQNHGCEAIIRGSHEILKKKVVLYSRHPEEDKAYRLDEFCDIKPDKREVKKYSLSHIITKLKSYGDADAFFRYKYADFIRKIGGVYLSIGGDNYCYGPEYREELYFLNRMIHEHGGKSVLWGCSIEPDILKEKRVREDMKLYSAIVARESLTYEALITSGLGEKAHLYPDPAFCLPVEKTDLPNGWCEGKMIGINLSPLVQRLPNGEMIYDNYVKLISHLLENTDYHIALIPHVVWEHNNDLVPLKKLFDTFQNSGRVVLIDENKTLNCCQLKWMISQCRFMIAARTHASIAAYSTGVPTLVVGYSIKSRGIATDIFGTDASYVVASQSLNDPMDLSHAFDEILTRESDILQHLKTFMPSYCRRAEEAGKEIRKLMI